MTILSIYIDKLIEMKLIDEVHFQFGPQNGIKLDKLYLAEYNIGTIYKYAYNNNIKIQ